MIGDRPAKRYLVLSAVGTLHYISLEKLYKRVENQVVNIRLGYIGSKKRHEACQKRIRLWLTVNPVD